jgi:polysaccharide export outer membrane protein
MKRVVMTSALRRVFPLLLCAAGCTGPLAKPAAQSDAALDEALRQVEAEHREYRIGPQDLLTITVYREDDLKKEARVAEDGKIRFPLAGEVTLGGLTTMEAETVLHDALRAYLVDPEVSVEIKEYRSHRVFVLGEVAKPGSYDYSPDKPLTVVEAIALAGGFTKYGAAGHTKVVRRVGKEFTNIVVPVDQVMRGDKSKDVSLLPDDVVYVPETLF